MALKSIKLKKGDTLPKIAKRHGVTLEQLMRDNGIPVKGVALSVGMRILVPKD